MQFKSQFAILWFLVCTSGMYGGTGHLGADARVVVVAWNDPSAGGGRLAALDVDPPWEFLTAPLDIGLNSIIRSNGQAVFAVSQQAGTVTIVDAVSMTVLHTHVVGGDPVDIALIDDDRAFVSRQGATHLLILDPQTGATRESVDLSVFADADGIPDMNLMVVHGNRLFVQVQREDDINGGFAAPALLAVIDVETETLVDADPDTPGVQAIELQGAAPKLKMQVLPGTNQLLVGATGEFFDMGGLEVVDGVGLQSEGLVIAESDGQTGADLGAFVMITPEEGFLAFSTDFATSSHLKPFSISGGVPPGPDLHVSLGYFAPTLVHDSQTDVLFWPEGTLGATGVLVFDAASGALLTPDPIATSGQPTDLILFERTSFCPGDLNNDEQIDAADLAILLGQWGPGTGPADLTGDGVVNAADLAILLGQWGVCVR